MKQTFELLKKVLDDIPCLYLRKQGLPWRIISDRSDYAVGGVLEQNKMTTTGILFLSAVVGPLGLVQAQVSLWRPIGNEPHQTPGRKAT